VSIRQRPKQRDAVWGELPDDIDTEAELFRVQLDRDLALLEAFDASELTPAAREHHAEPCGHAATPIRARADGGPGGRGHPPR
jgi:hypothetical protein